MGDKLGLYREFHFHPDGGKLRKIGRKEYDRGNWEMRSMRLGRAAEAGDEGQGDWVCFNCDWTCWKML